MPTPKNFIVLVKKLHQLPYLLMISRLQKKTIEPKANSDSPTGNSMASPPAASTEISADIPSAPPTLSPPDWISESVLVLMVISPILGTGSVLWEKALKPFWFLDFDDLALKWLKSLPDKSFSRIIPLGGTSAETVAKNKDTNRMLTMMGIRCQCYRKLLALSIRKLRLSFQRSSLRRVWRSHCFRFSGN